MITVNTREDYLKELSKLLPINCIAMEIGVLYGDFSQQILDIINPMHLTLIDPYETGGEAYDSGLTSAYSTNTDYENLLQRFKNEISENKVQVIRKYSYEVASRYFSSIHIIYHDASHHYKDIKNDLNDWLPNLKEDGLMCGHDYIDVSDFGVIKAVNEFMEEQGFEMIIFNTNGGDWALKRKQQ